MNDYKNENFIFIVIRINSFYSKDSSYLTKDEFENPEPKSQFLTIFNFKGDFLRILTHSFIHFC